MMAKKTIKISAVLCSILFVAACSESEQGNTPSTTTIQIAQKDQTSEKQSVDPVVEEGIEKENINLQELIQISEQALQHASELGYEWNTTRPLLVKAHTAVKEANHDLAITLFQEVKQQSELAIAQAKYADDHWRLLIPKNN